MNQLVPERILRSRDIPEGMLSSVSAFYYFRSFLRKFCSSGLVAKHSPNELNHMNYMADIVGGNRDRLRAVQFC